MTKQSGREGDPSLSPDTASGPGDAIEQKYPHLTPEQRDALRARIGEIAAQRKETERLMEPPAGALSEGDELAAAARSAHTHELYDLTPPREDGSHS